MPDAGYSGTPLVAKLGLKVCAVDAIWSGLKLVVRREARAAHIHARMRR